MRTIFGNYVPTQGRVAVLHDGHYVDITSAEPTWCSRSAGAPWDMSVSFSASSPAFRRLISRWSRFWRTASIPTKPASAQLRFCRPLGCQRRIGTCPATFSGGEQQRVNIARSFVREYPILLLDEPTASLDAANRAIVVELIQAALDKGTAMIGIFHDADVRDAVATRLFQVSDFKAAA